MAKAQVSGGGHTLSSQRVIATLNRLANLLVYWYRNMFTVPPVPSEIFRKRPRSFWKGNGMPSSGHATHR